MSQQTSSDSAMHHDHRHWQADVSMWRDDIDNWNAAHKAALKELERMKEKLNDHAKALACHVDQVDAHEARLLEHEHAVVSSARDGAEVSEDSLTHHVKEAAKHEQLQGIHERMKRHHHTVIAHVQMLKATLDAAL